MHKLDVAHVCHLLGSCRGMLNDFLGLDLLGTRAPGGNLEKGGEAEMMTGGNFYQMQANQPDLFLLAVPGYSSKNSRCLVKGVAAFHGDGGLRAFTEPLPKLVWSKKGP